MKNYFRGVVDNLKKYPHRDDDPEEIIEEVYAGPDMFDEPAEPEPAEIEPDDAKPEEIPDKKRRSFGPEDWARMATAYAGPQMMFVYAGPSMMNRPMTGIMFGTPWICTGCGKENGPLAQSCGYCGAPKPVPVAEEPKRPVPGDVFCPVCGALNAANTKFCPECGSPLENATPYTGNSEEQNV